MVADCISGMTEKEVLLSIGAFTAPLDRAAHTVRVSSFR